MPAFSENAGALPEKDPEKQSQKSDGSQMSNPSILSHEISGPPGSKGADVNDRTSDRVDNRPISTDRTETYKVPPTEQQFQAIKNYGDDTKSSGTAQSVGLKMADGSSVKALDSFDRATGEHTYLVQNRDNGSITAYKPVDGKTLQALDKNGQPTGESLSLRPNQIVLKENQAESGQKGEGAGTVLKGEVSANVVGKGGESANLGGGARGGNAAEGPKVLDMGADTKVAQMHTESKNESAPPIDGKLLSQLQTLGKQDDSRAALVDLMSKFQEGKLGNDGKDGAVLTVLQGLKPAEFDGLKNLVNESKNNSFDVKGLDNEAQRNIAKVVDTVVNRLEERPNTPAANRGTEFQSFVKDFDQGLQTAIARLQGKEAPQADTRSGTELSGAIAEAANRQHEAGKGRGPHDAPSQVDPESFKPLPDVRTPMAEAAKVKGEPKIQELQPEQIKTAATEKIDEEAEAEKRRKLEEQAEAERQQKEEEERKKQNDQERMYTVVQHDTLNMIAQKFFSNANYAEVIYDRNLGAIMLDDYKNQKYAKLFADQKIIIPNTVYIDKFKQSTRSHKHINFDRIPYASPEEELLGIFGNSWGGMPEGETNMPSADDLVARAFASSANGFPGGVINAKNSETDSRERSASPDAPAGGSNSSLSDFFQIGSSLASRIESRTNDDDDDDDDDTSEKLSPFETAMLEEQRHQRILEDGVEAHDRQEQTNDREYKNPAAQHGIIPGSPEPIDLRSASNEQVSDRSTTADLEGIIPVAQHGIIPDSPEPSETSSASNLHGIASSIVETGIIPEANDQHGIIPGSPVPEAFIPSLSQTSQAAAESAAAIIPEAIAQTSIDSSTMNRSALGDANAISNATRRTHVFQALGITEKSDTAQKHAVHLGESLRSIAQKLFKSPAYWRLLAIKNDLSTATDSRGNPVTQLKRGQTLTLPNAAELESFSKNPESPSVVALTQDELGILLPRNRHCANCNRKTLAMSVKCAACLKDIDEFAVSSSLVGQSTQPRLVAVGQAISTAAPQANEIPRRTFSRQALGNNAQDSAAQAVQSYTATKQTHTQETLQPEPISIDPAASTGEHIAAVALGHTADTATEHTAESVEPVETTPSNHATASQPWPQGSHGEQPGQILSALNNAVGELARGGEMPSNFQPEMNFSPDTEAPHYSPRTLSAQVPEPPQHPHPQQELPHQMVSAEQLSQLTNAAMQTSLLHTDDSNQANGQAPELAHNLEATDSSPAHAAMAEASASETGSTVPSSAPIPSVQQEMGSPSSNSQQRPTAPPMPPSPPIMPNLSALRPSPTSLTLQDEGGESSQAPHQAAASDAHHDPHPLPHAELSSVQLNYEQSEPILTAIPEPISLDQYAQVLEIETFENNTRALIVALQLYTQGEWMTVFDYHVFANEVVIHKYQRHGGRRMMKKSMPARQSKQMAWSHFRANWEAICKEFWAS